MTFAVSVQPKTVYGEAHVTIPLGLSKPKPVNRLVHFVLTAGKLIPQYQRAIRSAAVHQADAMFLWYIGARPDVRGLGVEAIEIDQPEWLDGQHPAHVSDVLGYDIAYRYGGLILPLDSISIRPAWDLLGDADAVFATDAPEDSGCVDPYNSIYLARQHADVFRLLTAECERCVRLGKTPWGFTGPLLLTHFVHYHSGVEAAPFPALCGWEGSYIWRFYLGAETPGSDVRVIHLFSGAYPELWWGDSEGWFNTHPDFRRWAPPASTRNPNADLLALPVT